MDHEKKMRLDIVYEGFDNESGLMFPEQIKVDLIESTIKTTMDISYGQVVFNDSINVVFEAPGNYTREHL